MILVKPSFSHLLLAASILVCVHAASIQSGSRKNTTIPYDELSEHISLLQSSVAKRDDIRTFVRLRYFADLYASLSPEKTTYGAVSLTPQGVVLSVGQTGYISGAKITANLNPAFISGEIFVLDDLYSKFGGSVIFIDIPNEDYLRIKTLDSYTLGTSRAVTKMRRPTNPKLISRGLVTETDGCRNLKSFVDDLVVDPSYALIVPSTYLCFDASIIKGTAYYVEAVTYESSGGTIIVPTYAANLNGVLLGSLSDGLESPVLKASKGLKVGETSVASLPEYSVDYSVEQAYAKVDRVYKLADSKAKAAYDHAQSAFQDAKNTISELFDTTVSKVDSGEIKDESKFKAQIEANKKAAFAKVEAAYQDIWKAFSGLADSTPVKEPETSSQASEPATATDGKTTIFESESQGEQTSEQKKDDPIPVVNEESTILRNPGFW